MNGIETSVLVRYFMGDHPELSPKATALLDGLGPMAIGLVALAETAFVLTHHYRVPRSETVDQLIGFLRKPTIRPLGAEKERIIDALLLCRDSERVSFADALIQAEAAHGALEGIYTCDRRFPTLGVPLRFLNGGTTE